jgi:hypothetical protein
MSFQLTFLGYYPINSQQLKKQTHSVKRRNWSHRKQTVQADGPKWTAEADGDCGRPQADKAAIHLRRTALEDGPSDRRTATPSDGWRAADRGGWRPCHPPGGRPTSMGSSDMFGRPADADMDVRTHDNPKLDSI